MISILLIGSLRSPPPIRLRRTSPYAGGRINRSTLTPGIMWYIAEHTSCPLNRGKGGGVSHQRGNAFPSPVRAVVRFSTNWRRSRPPQPSRRRRVKLKNPRGKSPVKPRLRSRRQPSRPPGRIHKKKPGPSEPGFHLGIISFLRCQTIWCKSYHRCRCLSVLSELCSQRPAVPCCLSSWQIPCLQRL